MITLREEFNPHCVGANEYNCGRRSLWSPLRVCGHAEGRCHETTAVHKNTAAMSVVPSVFSIGHSVILVEDLQRLFRYFQAARDSRRFDARPPGLHQCTSLAAMARILVATAPTDDRRPTTT